MRWPGICKLVEECGEVVQVAAKLMSTGGNVIHWDGSNLKFRLEAEIADVMAACDFFIETNAQHGLDASHIESRRAEKLKKFREWYNEGKRT